MILFFKANIESKTPLSFAFKHKCIISGNGKNRKKYIVQRRKKFPMQKVCMFLYTAVYTFSQDKHFLKLNNHKWLIKQFLQIPFVISVRYNYVEWRKISFCFSVERIPLDIIIHKCNNNKNTPLSTWFAYGKIASTSVEIYQRFSKVKLKIENKTVEKFCAIVSIYTRITFHY